MRIGHRTIDGNKGTFIIAEIAQAHEGSLGLAHSFIDAAANAGADAIKFQTHIALAESTRDEPFRIRMSGQDADRFDYWQRMEFTPSQWHELAAHSSERGLMFLSSAFSVDAVQLLQEVGVPAWKVGSGEVFNDQLLDAMSATGKPVMVSTGMADWDEINAAYRRVIDRGAPAAIFQCTSKYPTPLEQVGFNVISELRSEFNCPVGLSDHSGTVHPSLLALAHGVDLLEVHVTFDRTMYGPDAAASLTFEELASVVASNRAFAKMRDTPVDKDALANELLQMRGLFSKSLALRMDQTAGTELTAEMLTVKKPGTGITADQESELVGCVLTRDVSADRLLVWEDIEIAGTKN